MRSKPNPSHNPWKRAFLTLIILLVGLTAFVAFAATRPVPKPPSSTIPAASSTSSFEVTLNKDQLNSVAAYYLEYYQKKSKQNYSFAVEEEAVLTGSAKILSVDVNYGLAFTPKVLANGNVELKAKKLAVGALTMPVPMVLSYAASHYKLPKWIHLDPRQKAITLDLTQFTTNGIHYRAVKLDTSGAGTFKFEVQVPKVNG